jgi:hypothetical protein
MTLQLLAVNHIAQHADGKNAYLLLLNADGVQSVMHVLIGPRKTTIDGWDTPEIDSDLDLPSQAALLDIVENMDKSGRMMMHEFAPVADPPSFIPEKMRPVSIAETGRDESGNYLFEVGFSLESGTRTYKFNVEPHKGGLDYEDHFYDDMGGSTTFALPLFAAIVGFFRVNHSKSVAR